MNNEAKENLKGLLNTFPRQKGQSADAMATGFYLACQDIESEAIIAAVRLFNNGMVEDVNPDFAPTPARFARVAQQCQTAINNERLRAEALSRPRLENPQERKITEQDRARVGMKMKAFCEELRARADLEWKQNDMSDWKQEAYENAVASVGTSSIGGIPISDRLAENLKKGTSVNDRSI